VVETITPDRDHFTFTAKEDGLYWLNMVLAFKDGRTDPSDVTRGPSLKLLIDTTPPTVRITSVRRNGNHIDVAWEAADAHLDESETRAAFRVAGEKTDRVNVPVTGSRVGLNADTDAAGTVRVTVRDRAGNTAKAEKEVPGR
jgi:hypothetical protein